MTVAPLHARGSASAAEPAPVPLTARSIALSIGLAFGFGYFIPVIDFKFSNTFLGAMHMPAGAIAVLLALLLVINPLLRGLDRHLGFNRAETLTVYISCLFSALVPGRGAENFFVPNILSSFYNANRSNHWFETLAPYIKPWMTPALNPDGSYNSDVTAGWYQGSGVVPWAHWAVPLLAWSVLILCIHFMHACLGVMLRAQWAEREALAFPLLRLPLDMTEEGEGRAGFFQNPLVWCGFAISVVVELANGLHLYFPNFPAIPLQLPTSEFFTDAPWNQLGNIQMQIFPAIVGISFLLTTEVSFSLWFIHLASIFVLVLAYSVGISPDSMDSPFWTRGWAKGFIGYQQVGAIIAYSGLMLWTGREHWNHIVRRAMGQTGPRPSEANEAMPYPVAFWGFAGAFCFVTTWTVAAGVRPDVALLLWAFYLAVALCLTRLVAEAGLLFVQTGWMPLGPLAFLLGEGPGHIVNIGSAVPGAMISNSLMLDMRGFTLPSFLQGFKLAHDQGIAARPLLRLCAACILISFTVGIVTVINLGYHTGGTQLQNWWASAAGNQPANSAMQFTRGIQTNYVANWFWVAVGAALTVAMMALRSRFAWFPLHPLGLIMCVPFAMHAMWLSIFLGWLAKVMITRFGGNDGYRRLIPLFMGLALGDIVMVVFWIAVDGWNGRMGHALLPF